MSLFQKYYLEKSICFDDDVCSYVSRQQDWMLVATGNGTGVSCYSSDTTGLMVAIFVQSCLCAFECVC